MHDKNESIARTPFVCWLEKNMTNKKHNFKNLWQSKRKKVFNWGKEPLVWYVLRSGLGAEKNRIAWFMSHLAPIVVWCPKMDILNEVCASCASECVCKGEIETEKELSWPLLPQKAMSVDVPASNLQQHWV